MLLTSALMDHRSRCQRWDRLALLVLLPLSSAPGGEGPATTWQTEKARRTEESDSVWTTMVREREGSLSRCECPCVWSCASCACLATDEMSVRVSE